MLESYAGANPFTTGQCAKSELEQLKNLNSSLTNDVDELTQKRIREANYVKELEARVCQSNKQITQLAQKLESCAKRESELQIRYEEVRMKLRCYEKLIQDGKISAKTF